MTDRLSDADVRHLLGLRSMLSDALRYSSHASPLQRTTATVLLDGIVERALHLVAVSRAVKIPVKADFNTLVDVVRREMGSEWVPSHLPDVRQLHMARNAAQHEGLAPDRDQLTPWANAVVAFLHGLIEARFGVDLDRVALWDCVVEEGLRAGLREAARALEAGDASGSVQASRATISDADAQWQRLHGMRQPSGSSRIGTMFDMGGNNPIDAALAELAHEARLSTFAENPSEVAWFFGLARERPQDLDLDDAERAYAFAVSWVLGFEAARAVWTPDRRARSDRAARLVREADEPAAIDSVLVAQPSAQGAGLVVRLRGVPGDDYEAWVYTLNVLLHARAQDARRGWHVRADGTARISLADVADLEKELRGLSSALVEADQKLHADRRQDAERQIALDARIREYNRAVAEQGALPDWVAAVEYRPEAGRGPGIVVILTETAPREADSFVRDAVRPGDLIRFAPRSFRLEPGCDAPDLVAALWAADPYVQLRVDEQSQLDAYVDPAKADLLLRAQIAVRDLSL